MMYASIFIFLIMLLLNTMFKIASFFRLGIPLLYVFAVPVLFPDWLREQETLATGILFAMLGLVVLSWVVTICRKLRRGRARRYDADEDGR